MGISNQLVARKNPKYIIPVELKSGTNKIEMKIHKNMDLKWDNKLTSMEISTQSLVLVR